MENRIVIFEDNHEHWSCIKSMLEAGGLKKYYPVTDKEFRDLKISLQELYSSIPVKKEQAKNYLLELIKKDDFLLLDYILKIDDININCIKIYIDLKLGNNALIYTGQISRHFVKIEDQLKENSLQNKIISAMKPDDLLVSYEIKEDIDFLCNNIWKANNLSDSGENTDFAPPPVIRPEK